MHDFRFPSPEYHSETSQNIYGLTVVSRDTARAMINSNSDAHYVYVLCKPDGMPFYVGKGKGSRVFQHEAEAHNPCKVSHKLNLIRKISREGGSIGYVIDAFFSDEKACLAHERKMIARIGRFDLNSGPLTNQIDGGEGAANPSEEVRARHANSLGGEAEDPERRTGNMFLASISGRQASVPIKPWSSLRSRAHLLRPSPNKPVPAPTERMARAIAASALANLVMLQPGAVIPRRLKIDSVEFAIENGCGGDMIHAGVVLPLEPRSEPLEERLELTEFGYRAVVGLLGTHRLIELGVLEPDTNTPF